MSLFGRDVFIDAVSLLSALDGSNPASYRR
jgi:hypothetical protein